MVNDDIIQCMIKDESRLLTSSNSKHGHGHYFCMNCLQGFPAEISRDNHFKYCKDNETVRIEMPKRGSFVKFHDMGNTNSRCLPFVMYADFAANLEFLNLIQKNRT